MALRLRIGACLAGTAKLTLQGTSAVLVERSERPVAWISVSVAGSAGLSVCVLLIALGAWTLLVVWCTFKCNTMASYMARKDAGTLCMMDQISPELVGRLTIESVRDELRGVEMSTQGSKVELVERLVRQRRRQIGEEA
jgi:hypothetical protein